MARVYESNGPEVKIRGNPAHIAEKYMQLARDAQTSGDPVSAENYFQHAEHYYPSDCRRAGAVPPGQPPPSPSRRPKSPGAGTRRRRLRGWRRRRHSSRTAAGRDDLRDARAAALYAARCTALSAARADRRPPRRPGRSKARCPPKAMATSTGCHRSSPAGSRISPSKGCQGSLGSQAIKAAKANGHDSQGDRFPLHRRRRRHRGPRNEAQGGDAGGETSPRGE